MPDLEEARFRRYIWAIAKFLLIVPVTDKKHSFSTDFPHSLHIFRFSQETYKWQGIK